MKTRVTPLVKHLQKRLIRYKRYLKQHFSKKKNKRRATYIGLALVVAILVASNVIIFSQSQTEKYELEAVQNRNLEQQEQLESSLEHLRAEHENKDEEIEATQKELQELKNSNQELERQLQARRARGSNVALAESVQAQEAPQTSSQSVSSNGSCRDWMEEAGISNMDIAHQLIMKESGCNPNAVNPTSGACGIPQDINGCTVGHNPVDQMKWMQDYVVQRYGSWAGAWSHFQANNWY